MSPRRTPPPEGLHRADRNWYRATDDAGIGRSDVSWHFLREMSRDSTAALTLCGETIERPQVSAEALPRGKTCESCMRLDQADTLAPVEAPDPAGDSPPAPDQASSPA